MLRDLRLTGFKSFENLHLPLGALTVLSGTNGGGKSSVIQALVLMSQTVDEQEWGTALLLNGPDLSLGAAVDALNQASTRNQLAIGASAEKEEILWTFEAEDRKALSLNLQSVVWNEQKLALNGPIRWLLPASRAESSSIVRAFRQLSWISAERSGPRELLPLLDKHNHARVGARGELAAGLLYWRQTQQVAEPLRMNDEPPTLFHQVRAWMRYFFPGCDLRILPIEGASYITLRLRSDSRAEFQRPQNVGFGLTQLFPVLVAILSASPGDILLLENPEVHLHPRAQQEIGFLIARLAASGVQVLVETHSDHVLNGIRLAVKNEQIGPSSLAVHFFTRSPSDGKTTIISPGVDADGRLDAWPEGFFDQFDRALAALL